MRADQVTPAHIGSTVTVQADGFGASGTLAGVMAAGTSTVVLHIEADGSTGTCMVPWNADVEVDAATITGWTTEGSDCA